MEVSSDTRVRTKKVNGQRVEAKTIAGSSRRIHSILDLFGSHPCVA